MMTDIKAWVMTNLAALLGVALVAAVVGLGYQRIEIAHLEVKVAEAATKLEKQGREQAETYARGLEKAREDTKAMQRDFNNALARKDQQLQAKDRQLAAAATTSDGLRHDLASVPERIRNASDAAVREYAAAAAVVLDDCQRAYLDMAGKAQGHAIDVGFVLDAWPVLPGERGQQPEVKPAP